MCTAVSRQPVVSTAELLVWRNFKATRKEREVVQNYSHRPFWHWRLLRKGTVDWKDNQAGKKKEKKEDEPVDEQEKQKNNNW